MTEEKLLNCPFCDAEAKLVEEISGERQDNVHWIIGCFLTAIKDGKSIGCMIQMKHWSKEAVIEKWNTRKGIKNA